MFSRRITLAVVPAAALLALVSSCANPGSPSATQSPGRSESASASVSAPAPAPASVSAAASATPSARPTSASTPIAIPCGTLVGAQTVYNYNPNFVLLSSFTPKAGSAAARAASSAGTACEWENTTSNDTIDVSVAHLTASAIPSLKASAGTASGGWGADAGYFSVSGGVGTATAFVGNDWIVAASTDFGQATDADAFMNSAVAAVR